MLENFTASQYQVLVDTMRKTMIDRIKQVCLRSGSSWVTTALSTLPADQLIIEDEEKDEAQSGEISC